MDDINDLTVDDLQFYLRKYRFNDECLNYFRGKIYSKKSQFKFGRFLIYVLFWKSQENEIDGFTLNLMTEIPDYFSNKLGYKLKFKLMFLELTGRDIDLNVRLITYYTIFCYT
jgi:hypothetical protein